MKEIETTCGCRVYDDNGILIGFKKDYNGEGYVFKDNDAYENRPDDICYISEYSCEDEENDDGIIPLSSATKAGEGETRNTILAQVREHRKRSIERYARNLFYSVEWESIETRLSESNY